MVMTSYANPGANRNLIRLTGECQAVSGRSMSTTARTLCSLSMTVNVDVLNFSKTEQ